jgi:hypothetical protein
VRFRRIRPFDFGDSLALQGGSRYDALPDLRTEGRQFRHRALAVQEQEESFLLKAQRQESLT